VLIKKRIVLMCRRTHGQAQGLGLITARNHTTVIVGKDGNGFALQRRLENPLTRCVKVVAIDKSKHIQKYAF
jgi:hypothetical protein